MTPVSIRRFCAQLKRDNRALAMLEFALTLPLFLGFVLAGIEMGNYVLANNRTQRLAAMTADLVAQSGAGAIGATEAQIYDLFSALDVTALPFDLRKHGRVVVTGIKGTVNNNKPENTMQWQRFDGDYVDALPVVGCMKTSAAAILPGDRKLPSSEMLFHVQVTYEYQPIFSTNPFRWLNLPISFTRAAMFHARSKDFVSPTQDPSGKFPRKDNCYTADGL